MSLEVKKKKIVLENIFCFCNALCVGKSPKISVFSQELKENEVQPEEKR